MKIRLLEAKAGSLLQRAKRELEEVSPQAYQEAVWILSSLLNKKISSGAEACSGKEEPQLSHQNTAQDFSLGQTVLSAKQEEEFWSQIQKRKKRYPLDYLLGESYFLGHKFLIEEGVFIPRPDTEILAERIFKLYPKQKSLKIMDWGAGAGAICLSLLSHFPKAQALAVEIHSKSLDCLKKNSARLGLSARVSVLQGDVFKIDFKSEGFFSQGISPLSSSLRESNCYQKKDQAKKSQLGGAPFDLIVANPPYIDPQDSQIESSVYFFEPPLALFSKEKGMGHIRSWFYKAMDCLNEGACYAFEFGWNQSQLVRDFLSSQSVSYEILKDKRGYDRAVLVFKK